MARKSSWFPFSSRTPSKTSYMGEPCISSPVCLLPTVHRQVLTLFYPDSVPLETHSGVTSWGEEGQWINLPTPTYFSPDTAMFVTHFLLLDLCEMHFATKIRIWKPTSQSGMHHWGFRSNFSSELVFLFHSLRVLGALR